MNGQFELFPELTGSVPHLRDGNVAKLGEALDRWRNQKRDRRRSRWRLRQDCVQTSQEFMSISLRARYSLGDEASVDKDRSQGASISLPKCRHAVSGCPFPLLALRFRFLRGARLVHSGWDYSLLPVIAATKAERKVALFVGSTMPWCEPVAEILQIETILYPSQVFALRTFVFSGPQSWTRPSISVPGSGVSLISDETQVGIGEVCQGGEDRGQVGGRDSEP